MRIDAVYDLIRRAWRPVRFGASDNPSALLPPLAMQKSDVIPCALTLSEPPTEKEQ